MKNIKFKIFFLFFVGFLQISNNFVFGMEQKEDQKCLLCLASTYYVTDDEVNLINKRKEEIHENAEGLRIGSEEDIVPVDPSFRTLVNESDRPRLIPLSDSEIVEISHFSNDYKHYFHTTCFQEYMQSKRYEVSNESLICPIDRQYIQTAITLDDVKIYPEIPLEYKIVHEDQTTNGLCLKYKINKIAGFSQLKNHLLSLAQQKIYILDLDIDDSIHTIPEYFFSGLETLEIQTLYLNNNKLTSLPTSIGSLTSLKVLYVWKNKLTSLPAEIGQLSSLKWLFLAHNQLTELPARIGQLEKLEQLYLQDNKLASLPKEIGNITNLQKLILSRNRLDTLPSKIINLTNLKQLWLAGNRLTFLPKKIGNLISLKRLVLSFNNIVPWPEQILQPLLSKDPQTLIIGKLLQRGEVEPVYERADYHNHLSLKYKINKTEGFYPLKNHIFHQKHHKETKFSPVRTISELTLIIDNNIHTIPENFFLGLETQKLNLSNNKLSSLPKSIGELRNLKMLNLSHNILGSLPAEIGYLKNLQELNLEHNKLSSLPRSIQLLTNLEILDLCNNKINPWPTRFIKHCQRLSETEIRILGKGQQQY